MKSIGGIGSVVVILAAVGLATTAASADVLSLDTWSIDLEAKSLTDLLGANPVAYLASPRVTPMDAYPLNPMSCTVYSQAYSNQAGTLWAYLYQITNAVTSQPLKRFTLWPFWGADEDTQMGWLTGTVPTGFFTGTQEPYDVGEVAADDTGSIVAFPYDPGHRIDKGETTMIMYVLSELPPDEIRGNVIDGGVATGTVVGPIPEPAALSLLALGSGFVLLRRKRK